MINSINLSYINSNSFNMLSTKLPTELSDKISNPITKYIYNNIDNLVLVDKYGTTVPAIFNEFTGLITHNFKPIKVDKRILKKINMYNCICQIIINNNLFNIVHGIEYFIDLFSLDIDFIQFKIQPINKQTEWSIELEMCDKSNLIDYQAMKSNLNDALYRNNMLKYQNNYQTCYM